MRTGKCRQVDPTSRPKDYCDSLADLPGLVEASQQPNAHAPALVPYVPPPAAGEDKPRLVVCHDYKGGYTEGGAELRRDYTFNWWQFTDTFIYFSHHRVSLPPPAWVRTAHQHRTKILGTLIFEWDEGKKDLANLVGGDGVLRLDYADALVELAVARGFEGWLVNVEVPASQTQVESLLVWLAYLRDRVKERVIGGEVMWYDGLNAHGKVKWQNRLSPLNQPFLDNADALFLNYFWQPDWLSDTAAKMDALGRPRSQALVGVDVWGRGQYGGGGFDSWLALDAIEASPPGNAQAGGSSPSVRRGLSAAVFAPAWTVESEHLAHDLSTAEGYARWLADEMYLWRGGEPTPNVEKERIRREKERKHDRAVRHVLGLANHLAAPRSALARINPPKLDYNAPLPPLPGKFRPITDYRPRPTAPVRSACNSFRTNFGLGSGHAFFANGDKVHDTATGWTDAGLVQAGPALAYEWQEEGTKVTIADGDAWFGAQACRVEALAASGVHFSTGATVPLCPIDVVLASGRPLRVRVVWKPAGAGNVVPDEVSVAPHLDASEDGPSGSMVHRDRTEKVGGTGWWRTEAEVLSMQEDGLGIPLAAFGVRVMAKGAAAEQGVAVLIGELSLAPLDLGPPRVIGLEVDQAKARVRWRAEPAGACDCFTVWQLPSGSTTASTDGAKLLGVTAATEFLLPADGLEPGARVAVLAVGPDGTASAWDEAAVIEPS